MRIHTPFGEYPSQSVSPTVLCNGGSLVGNWGTCQSHHLPTVETDQLHRSFALGRRDEGGGGGGGGGREGERRWGYQF